MWFCYVNTYFCFGWHWACIYQLYANYLICACSLATYSLSHFRHDFPLHRNSLMFSPFCILTCQNVFHIYIYYLLVPFQILSNFILPVHIMHIVSCVAHERPSFLGFDGHCIRKCQVFLECKKIDNDILHQWQQTLCIYLLILFFLISILHFEQFCSTCFYFVYDVCCICFSFVIYSNNNEIHFTFTVCCVFL